MISYRHYLGLPVALMLSVALLIPDISEEVKDELWHWLKVAFWTACIVWAVGSLAGCRASKCGHSEWREYKVMIVDTSRDRVKILG